MCTLIIGQNVIAPNTVFLAGNRDEDPARPSRGPDVLLADPRVVGGADAVAGGTWMAIRERRAAVAMLNRWRGDQPAPPPDGLRSRGQLTLDLARADATAPGAPSPRGFADAARSVAEAALASASYAPFSAVCAAPSGSLLITHRGGRAAPEFIAIESGWHVLTHRDLDDPGEPRAAHLRQMLGAWRPANAEAARERLITLLASHEPPRACIHEGPMVTVSSFGVWLAPARAQYHHLDGRPCEHALDDFSRLLAGPFDNGDT